MDNTMLPDGYFDVLDARNPYWSDASNESITLEVLFSWGGRNTTYIPFTASATDSESHGRELFLKAKTGHYGPIQLAPMPSVEAIQAEVRMMVRKATRVLNKLSIQLETLEDSITFGMANNATPEKITLIKNAITDWKKYRVNLSTISTQKGYPSAVIWPNQPSEKVDNQGGHDE